MTDTQTDRRQRSYNVSHATAIGQIIIQCRSRSRAPSVRAQSWLSYECLASFWRLLLCVTEWRRRMNRTACRRQRETWGDMWKGRRW